MGNSGEGRGVAGSGREVSGADGSAWEKWREVGRDREGREVVENGHEWRSETRSSSNILTVGPGQCP